MTTNIKLNGFEYEAKLINNRPYLIGHLADLSYANLRSANLRYADLSSADLSYADLRYANLSYANLRSANLRYADLSYADLSAANLRSADLSSANLSYADLRYANLSYANNFAEAYGVNLALVNEYTKLPEGWEVVNNIIVPYDVKEETEVMESTGLSAFTTDDLIREIAKRVK